MGYRSCLLGFPVDFHPEVTRVFHLELTRLKVMFCGLCWGQDMRGLPFRFGYCRADLEAEAFVASFEHMAAVGQAVEQSRCHLGVAEHRGPFAEAEVGCDHDAGALIELAQEVE